MLKNVYYQNLAHLMGVRIFLHINCTLPIIAGHDLRHLQVGRKTTGVSTGVKKKMERDVRKRR